MCAGFCFVALILVRRQDVPKPVAVLDIQGQLSPMPYYAPDVVVYSDGLVIYQTGGDFRTGKQFKSVTIPPQRLQELLPPSRVAALFAGDTLPRQDTSGVHGHAPFFVLDVWQDTLHRRVVIHGEPEMGSASFTDLVNRLSQFNSDRGKPWIPDSIEIDLRLVTHECNPTQAFAWPASLPHPAALPDTTFVRFRLASTLLGRVKDLLKKQVNGDCTPVLLEGKWWGVSYEFSYSGQELWRRQ